MPQAVLFMLVSTCSISLTAAVAKLLGNYLPVGLIIFLRFAVPALLSFWIMTVSRWERPDWSAARPMLVRGLWLVGAQGCFFLAILKLTLVEAVLLFSTGPLFIPLLERLLRGQRLAWGVVLGIVVAFSGVWLLSGLYQLEFRPYTLVGLGGGLFSALSQVTFHRISKGRLSPVAQTAWTFTVSALLCLPLLLWLDLPPALLEEPISWLLILALGLLTVNNQAFRSRALRAAPNVSMLAPLIYTALLFTWLWQWLWFDERLDAVQMLGVGLVVLGGLLSLSRRGRRGASRLEDCKPE